MKVSVIIPSYGRPQLLLKCLEALREQDFPPEEYEIIIVVDGGLKEYIGYYEAIASIPIHGNSPLIKSRCLSGKKGPAAARNAGWRQAKGELLLFADDDCLPPPQWIRAYWDAYIAGQPTGLAAFVGPVVVPIPEVPTDYEKSISRMEKASLVTANFCCTRATMERLGGFDENFRLAWREDSDMEFRLIRAGIPIYRVQEAVLVHPVRKARWGISLWLEKKNMADALLFKKHGALYLDKIRKGPVWNYYFILLFSLSALLLAYINQSLWALGCLAVWLFLMMRFIFMRLRHTRKSFGHIAEMVFTSLMIPYLSIYWTLTGALKYNVFFL